MHSHSSRYLLVTALRRKIVSCILKGEPIPYMLEWEAANAGINIPALRESLS